VLIFQHFFGDSGAFKYFNGFDVFKPLISVPPVCQDEHAHPDSLHRPLGGKGA